MSLCQGSSAGLNMSLLGSAKQGSFPTLAVSPLALPGRKMAVLTVLTVLTVVEEPVYTRDGLSGWQALKKKPQHVTARYVTINYSTDVAEGHEELDGNVSRQSQIVVKPPMFSPKYQTKCYPTPRIAQLETPTWPPCEAISTPVSWNALECWSTRHMIGGLYFHVKLHLKKTTDCENM